MADIGSLVANLMLNDAQFNKNINSAAKKTKSFSSKSNQYLAKAEKKWKSLGSTIFSLKGAFAAVLGGYGITKLGSSFLDAAKTSENFRVRLEVLLGSVEEGNRLFKEMENYAGAVPFTYEKVMESATQLSGVMKGGVDEIKEWMPLIGDLAAAAGVDIQKATEQVVRMYSAGAASADLFRERGILAMMGFKAGVSYSAEETRKMMFESWNKADSQFHGATDKMANTWDGMISMISDKWFKFRNLIMEAGVFDELKNTLSDINDGFGAWIENNKEIIKQKIPEYVEKIKAAATKLYEVVTQNKDVIEYGLIGLLVWGKKGAVIGGLIGKYSEFLDKSLEQASTVRQAHLDNISVAERQIESLKRQSEYANTMLIASAGNTKAQNMWRDSIESANAKIATQEQIISTNAKAINDLNKALKDTPRSDKEEKPKKPELPLLEDATPFISTPEFAGEYWLNLKKYSETFLNEETERMNQRFAFEKETDQLLLESKAQYYLDEAALKEQALIADIERMNKAAAKEKAIETQKLKMKQEFAKDWLSFSMDMATTMQALSTKESKGLFVITRGLAVAMATMAAFQASALALAHPPGPPTTIPMAHHALALGLAQAGLIAAVTIAELKHQGGIVGTGGGPHKMLPADTFSNAPRLHSGLRSDEYPAILQKGEEVIPADDVGDEYGDTPILQMNIVLDGRVLTQAVLHRVEIDSSQLKRLQKAIR